MTQLMPNGNTLREPAKESKWISVKDRLPEITDNSVLGHFANGSIETVHIEDFFTPDKSGYTLNEVLDNKVTHWMELPEPPNV